MYISRMQIDPRSVARTGLYGTHQNVWNLFADSPDRERDFIYRQDGNTILAVSSRKPLDTVAGWHIETKKYVPKVVAGNTFTFSLRVNPVVKSSSSGKLKKHDVVQYARKKILAEGLTPDRNQLAQTEGASWLVKKSAFCGFRVESSSILVEKYLFNQSMRTAKGKVRTISVMDIVGSCVVTDPELFITTLYKGIGSARGFGCGLLLIRRQ